MPPVRPPITLLALLDGLGFTLHGSPGNKSATPAAPLTDLTDDSRRVTPGSPGSPGTCFVARDTGDERWKDYVEAAVARGATAVLAPRVIDLPKGVTLATHPSIDQALAGRLAARCFGHPADSLRLVGVTGTNGKTTVATLTQYLLNAADEKCGLIGTVSIDEGHPDGPQSAELTTPGAIDLHRHFAAMVANGCKACAMEVSSHALDQGRVDGLGFDVAVFTNLTQDHLDYHGTMQAYGEAKAKLFISLKPDATAVINLDDAFAPRFGTMTDARVHWTSVSGVGERPYLEGEFIRPTTTATPIHRAAIVQLDATRSVVDFLLKTFHGQQWFANATTRIDLPLVGRHNVSNALQALVAAAAVMPEQGVDLVEALERCPAVPGRLEAVRVPPSEVLPEAPHPAVLVDYAHTPDALENVIHALRPVTRGRLIVVFGCGGDRDRTKRPKMAALACDLADHAILTSDNPRTEDPQRILDDALAGVPPEARTKVTVEIDRATAIRLAILDALPGDTVLIAGKGHEDYQIIGTTKHHFDDREHAAAALREWSAK